jgi:hypothetical protein
MDQKQIDFRKLKALKEDFAHITRHFDHIDWRTVRTEYYWRADKMPPAQALEHKIELVEYYNRYGVPKDSSYE